MDCEGCEYALLTLSCEELRRVRTWVVEVHGAPTPIVDTLRRCGFECRQVHEFPNGTSVWHFYY